MPHWSDLIYYPLREHIRGIFQPEGELKVVERLDQLGTQMQQLSLEQIGWMDAS